MTIDEAINAMVQHSLDNPDHGINCACKDKYIRAARNQLNLMPYQGSRHNNARYLFNTLLRSP